ncbi:MAG: hypothetical protein M3R53_04555 [Candidatus Eremiobacteraeota bacterium]|nr:hypothetical protein [Candidatus Eremiobacteraeota bacterium]
MAESDRARLLARALALPQAEPSDFFGERCAPPGVDHSLLKRIDDTGLRAKLVDARLAEGLQSPKGPQKIASIVRIYPAYDAPGRVANNGRAKTPPPKSQTPPERGLPSVEDMERLIGRIRDVEREVGGELSSEVDERIEVLKRSLADLTDAELEAAYRELGEALQQKRALASHVRVETFRRIERDPDFPPRAHLRLLRR